MHISESESEFDSSDEEVSFIYKYGFYKYKII